MSTVAQSGLEPNSDDAPPSYEASCGVEAQTSQLPEIAEERSISRTLDTRFPQSFNLYYKTLSRNLMIGEHQEQPLYAVMRHSGWSGKPPVILYDGPDKSSPVLATASFYSRGSSMKLMLPPMVGKGPYFCEEEMKRLADNNRNRYYFSIETESTNFVRETFEWRHGAGDTISALGADNQGWALLRLDPNEPSSITAGIGIPPREFKPTDLQKIVAAWSHMSVAGGRKVAKFAFFGPGAAGILGERWEIMAVITALGIYDWEETI
jgi:hypothetical protein